MVLKTQYTFAIGGTFTPEGFDETVNHIATSWQVSDQPEFGDDGRAGERDFIVYESLVDTTALKTLFFYAEDVLLPFRNYYLRAKYHSDIKSGRSLDPLVLKCTTGSNVVEILGRQDAVTKRVVADSSAIQEIEYAMRVDYLSNLKGLQGGNMFSGVAVVKNIDYTYGTLTLSQNCLFSGAFIFDFHETFQSEWSAAVKFDSTEGLWATIEFVTQPVDLDIPLTQSGTFTVLAEMSDSSAVSYQWQKKNVQGQFQNITGETAASLTLSNVALTDDQSVYRVLATSIYGQVIISNEVILTVIPITINILRNPRDTTFVQGGTATFDVVAEIVGSANLTYQWQKQEALGNTWEDIVGATSVVYTTPALNTASDLGDRYRVKVSNDVAPDIAVFTEPGELLERPYDLTLVYPDNTTKNWVFDIDGPVICDSTVGTTWNVIPQSQQIVDIKMWGKGTSSQYAGYTEGRTTLLEGNDYRIHTNVGGGPHGTGSGWPSNENGGGYTGIFNGLSASQSSALMIAGGSGGRGYGHGSSAGGRGGGNSGSAGTNSSDTQIGSTGGGGGTQTGPGGGGGAGGSAGSALQGGRGGNGQTNGYPNAGGGGGGGGGWYGGGGGGGGNDNGQSTRNASGGGGGSGYVKTSVVSSGLTANVDQNSLKSSGGTWDDTDPNRGNAGYDSSGSARLVMSSVLGLIFTDYAGRQLIFANNTYLTPPASMQKTFGTVFPGDTKCIDNARWQVIRGSVGYSSSTNYRIQYTTGGSKKPVFDAPPTDYNLAKMRDSNVVGLATDLTQWGNYLPYQSSFYQGLTHFSWSEDALASYAGNLWGYGLDYTGLTYGDSNVSPNYYQNGFSAFSHSNNGTVKYFGDGTNSPSFSSRTLEMWILPPGVPHITATQYYTASVPNQNPACAPSSYQYGIFTRSGGAQSTFSTTDNRQTIIIWAGQVVYNGPGSIINPFDGTATVGDYTYEAGTHRGSTYGWHADGTTCGTASSPNGDFGNAFDVRRWG